LNSDYSIKCNITENLPYEYRDYSTSCISNFDYFNLQQENFDLVLVHDGLLISNVIKIPVLFMNKVFMVNNSPLMFIQQRDFTFRLQVDARKIALLKWLNPDNIQLVVTFNELPQFRFPV
jgi:hypothetical protein